MKTANIVTAKITANLSTTVHAMRLRKLGTQWSRQEALQIAAQRRTLVEMSLTSPPIHAPSNNDVGHDKPIINKIIVTAQMRVQH